MVRCARFSVVLTAILALGVAASAQDEAITPLDRAVEAGQNDPAMREAFYDLYREAEVYVLLFGDAPVEQLDDMVGLPLRASAFQGLPLINVFDTEERMRAFVESRQLDSWSPLKLPGEATLSFMATDYYLLLNPDTPYQKFFGPEEIRFLQASGDGYVETAMSADAFEDLVPAAPEPAGLADALRTALAARREVREAWVFRHPATPADAAAPSYLILMRARGNDAAHAETMQAVGEAITGRIGDGRFVDFGFLSARRLRDIAPDGAEPFYTR